MQNYMIAQNGKFQRDTVIYFSLVVRPLGLMDIFGGKQENLLLFWYMKSC